MEVISIHVFKNSFGPILKLLSEHEIQHSFYEQRSATPMASGQIIEVIANASIWISLATVIVAFIKAKNSREIIIQTKDKQVIHAKGLDSKQLEKILERAEKITAIDSENE